MPDDDQAEAVLEEPEATPPAKLSLKVKLGFGICDLGGNLFFTIMGFYLLIFLTDTVHLAAGLAGTALMIGKLWDAVTDPAVGYLSDRTETRWGRRRPYIFFGSFMLYLMMIVMFTDPGIEGQRGLFVWAAVVYCLLNTGYTLVNIPYGALTPELTSDYDERTVLNGYRMVSAAFGTIIGAAATLMIVKAFASDVLGWSVMGAIMGAIMMITALITFFTVREPDRPPKSHVQEEGILKSYASVLKMKVFLLALLPWTLHITGINVIQVALLYYFRYIYNNETFFQYALLVLLASSIVLIPIWVKISKRIGKKTSYNIGMSIFAAAVLLFFFLGDILGVYFALAIMAMAGIGFATQYVMPYAIVPDIVEYDYAEHGVRREGVFYGLWTFTSKVGQAFAIFLSGWVLALFGYRPDVVQSALSKLGIKLLCGPIPAAFFIAGVIVLSFYPINRAFYDRILEKVKARDAGLLDLDEEIDLEPDIDRH